MLSTYNDTVTNSTETGKINFDGFAAICSDFLDEEDDEAMQNELREAFRMYDKEGRLLRWLCIYQYTSEVIDLPSTISKKMKRNCERCFFF